MRNAPALHARDHLPGGADPLPLTSGFPPSGVRAGLAQNSITVTDGVQNNISWTTTSATNTNSAYWEVKTTCEGPLMPKKNGVIMIEAMVGNWDPAWGSIEVFQFAGLGHSGTVRSGAAATTNGAQVSDYGNFAATVPPVRITIREFWNISVASWPANFGIGLEILQNSGASRSLNFRMYGWYITQPWP